MLCRSPFGRAGAQQVGKPHRPGPPGHAAPGHQFKPVKRQVGYCAGLACQLTHQPFDGPTGGLQNLL